jgi:hypothetical protein
MPKPRTADPDRAAAARAIAEVCLARIAHDGQLILDELTRLRDVETTGQRDLLAANRDVDEHESALRRVKELLAAWELAAPADSGDLDPAGLVIRQCADQLTDAVYGARSAETRPATAQTRRTGPDPAGDL